LRRSRYEKVLHPYRYLDHLRHGDWWVPERVCQGNAYTDGYDYGYRYDTGYRYRYGYRYACAYPHS